MGDQQDMPVGRSSAPSYFMSYEPPMPSPWKLARRAALIYVRVYALIWATGALAIVCAETNYVFTLE